MFPRLNMQFETLRERLRLRLAEYNLGLAMLIGGLILMGGQTFDLPPYVVAQQIVSQATLAWIMVALGGARLAVLIINGALPRGSPHLRSALSSLSGFIWFGLLIALLSFETPVLINAFLAAAVVTELAITFRATQDARQEDDKCRGGDDGSKSG